MLRCGLLRQLRPATSMDDSELIHDFLETGNQLSFELLVNRYKGRVFRLILSILGPHYRGDAEEATQDVFLLVFQQLSSFRGESQFGTWLYRIAYHRALDLKRQSRHRYVHVSHSALQPLRLAQDESPFVSTAALEQQQLFQECMDELPDLYRSVLYLHYWMGQSVSEISQLLLAPEGTIKSYLHRARQRMHSLLKRRGLIDGQ